MKAIPTDVYDKDGNLLRIEFHDGNGEHIIDAQWDENDEQTSEKRVEFRKWAYNHIARKGYSLYN
jgi:hypothetical protein